MKIVIAPDSFKESLSAMEVANAIEKGFQEIFPHAEYIKLPMADGGEGTVESMVSATKGRIIAVTVTGPLGDPVEGFFGILGDGKTAVIEMAAASGLHLVPPKQRNPLITSSFGTGELVLSALEHDVDTIILGIGGSATNDGGAGMMKALGASFKNHQGEILPEGGAALSQLADIDLSKLDPRLKNITLIAACDVSNPLCGKQGASEVFGPQKGATAEMVTILDNALLQYGKIVEKVTNKHVLTVEGAGAAGGMGAALLGLLNAKLRPGIDIVVDTLNLADIVKDADLVITGEGRTDSQTIKGKTPIGVAKVAKRFNKPTIAICGSLTKDYDIVHKHGLDAVFSSLYRVATLPEVLKEAKDSLFITARNVAAVWYIAEKQK